MKKLLFLCALLFPMGCSRAQDAATAVAPQTQAVDEWTRRSALYDFDKTRELNVEWGKSEDNIAAKITRLDYVGARGATVPAYYITPQGAAEGSNLPAVVLVHGKDGNIRDMVPVGLLLAARGYASIIPEVVGHGERNKGVALFNPDPTTMRDGFIESVGDIRRSIDVLSTRPEVDSTRVGYLGVSMGAILGTLVTATDERLRTAVLIVGGGDWQTISKQSNEKFARDRRQIGLLKPEEVAILDDIDPKNFAAHISPRPLLMISGTRDSIIPPASAKILFNAAREPKKQVWIESGHLIPPAAAAVPMLSWLQENLKDAQPAAVEATPARLAQ